MIRDLHNTRPFNRGALEAEAQFRPEPTWVAVYNARMLRGWVAILAVLLLGAAALAATYTVQPGDTLYSLAKRFGTTPEQLMQLNGLQSPNLRVGQTLEIPEQRYTVQKGDTLYSIAKRFGVSIEALRAANNLSGDAVRVGQVLTVPWITPGAQTPSSGGKPVTPPAPQPASPPPVVPPPATPPAPAPPVPVVVPGNPDKPDPNQLPPLPSGLPGMRAPLRPARDLPNGASSARPIPPPVVGAATLPSLIATTDPGSSGAAIIVHTVQPGDTLFNIARRYGVSVEAIKTLNNLPSDGISLGQALQIPASPVPALPAVTDLRSISERYLGVTYVYGGSSASGLDCSGFVTLVFSQIGVRLPRTSREQFQTGEAVERTDLRLGDLVFFDITGNGVSHVGIYLEAGEFIHAASNPGKVIKSRLEEKYYAQRYLGARRVLGMD